MITRQEATAKILGAKQKQKLTWEQIAKGVGRHKIWTTAALLGQHPMSAEEADSVIKDPWFFRRGGRSGRIGSPRVPDARIIGQRGARGPDDLPLL